MRRSVGVFAERVRAYDRRTVLLIFEQSHVREPFGAPFRGRETARNYRVR